MSVETLLHRAALPLDRARSAAFGLARRSPPIVRVIASRDARLQALALLQAAIAFALSAFCPVLLFVLGPLLLGVPHVASDVRYLLLRRGLRRPVLVGTAAFSAALVAVRVAAEATRRGTLLAPLEFAVAGVFVGWAALAAASEGASRRRATVAVTVAVALALAACVFPTGARLVFVFAHNAVALVLWAALFRTRRNVLVVPLAATAGLAALLATGAVSTFTLRHGLPASFGLHAIAAADGMAPGLRADLATGLLSAFVFLQAVHYAVWLFFVPQDDARGEGLTPFSLTAQNLLADFGAPGLTLVALASLGVIAFSLFDVVRTARLYLSLATFHGYLELALSAYFFTRGGRAAFAPRRQ